MTDITIPVYVDLSVMSSEQVFDLNTSEDKVRVPIALNESVYTINTDGFVASTEYWDSQALLIAEKNVVYIYTDRYVDSLGRNIPGFKVGDGITYLIDLPFNDDSIEERLSISVIDCGVGAG